MIKYKLHTHKNYDYKIIYVKYFLIFDREMLCIFENRTQQIRSERQIRNEIHRKLCPENRTAFREQALVNEGKIILLVDLALFD